MTSKMIDVCLFLFSLNNIYHRFLKTKSKMNLHFSNFSVKIAFATYDKFSNHSASP